METQLTYDQLRMRAEAHALVLEAYKLFALGDERGGLERGQEALLLKRVADRRPALQNGRAQ